MADLDKQDAAKRETSKRKNDLEAYILAMSSALTSDEATSRVRDWILLMQVPERISKGNQIPWYMLI